jgi:hypothetical protein
MPASRRIFLGSSIFALAGVTTGSITLTGCGASDTHMNSVASFGLELVNLQGNGADAYFPVARKMILNTFNIDTAFMLVSSATVSGWAEVLCQARVNRGGPPTFSGVAGYLPHKPSTDFGAVGWNNPHNLQLVGNASLDQDMFYSVILKAFVPVDGTASSTSRHVFGQPSLLLNAGDYLAFHMDHAGVPVDCEMQVVLGYTLL